MQALVNAVLLALPYSLWVLWQFRGSIRKHVSLERNNMRKKKPATPRELLIEKLTQNIDTKVHRGHYVSESAAMSVLWLLEDKGLLAPDWQTKLGE